MIDTLLVVAAAIALAPLLSALVGRVVRLPVVVVEIVLGILLGPAVLDLIADDKLLDALSQLGLVLLFFMAGSEIDFGRIAGRPVRRSLVGWTIAIVGSVAIGLLVGPTPAAAVYIGVALSSTALGTLIPVLIDTGRLRSPWGVAVTAVGAVGEFAPLIAISVFLTSRAPALAAVILVGFIVLAVAAIVVAARAKHSRLHGFISATLHTSGQFAVRLVLLIVALLVALSFWLGLDLLLGAFTAGVFVQYLLVSAPPADAEQVRSKLEAVAFGLLVPVFFVMTGVHFDIQTLLSDPQLLLLCGLFLVVMLALRGVTGLLSAPLGAGRRERFALVLLTATGLPIIVAVTRIAQADHELTTGVAAALVAAGLLTVLVFPALATTMLGKTPVPPPEAATVDDASW